MLRCLSTLGCQELALDDALALARRHALDGVELRALANTVELPGHLAATFGSPAALAARLRDEPVKVVAFDTSLKLSGGSASDREAFLAFVPWAEGLGVRWLRVFDGRASGASDAEAIAQAAESARWWRQVRHERGLRVDLMVETHDTLFTAAAIRAFLALAPGTPILWDAHHTWRKGGEEPLSTWPEIREAVVHVHIKDSIPQPSARHPFTYVLPGDGGFPVQPLLAALRADRFAGAVCLEWEKMWHPYLPPLEEALKAAAERRWW